MKRLILIVLALIILPASTAFAAPATGLTDMEKLGRFLFKDKNLSYNGTQSCQVCHHPFAGFADRRNERHPATSVVSIGADGVSKGGRNAPSAAYAGYSPHLEYIDGGWVGGLFWDGRADGSVLGDPLAEQAMGPPLNAVEMAMPNRASIIDVIEESAYADLFFKVFDPDAFNNVEIAYTDFGRALAAYQRSGEVTRFTSRFDTSQASFSEVEQEGATLFQENCRACHTTEAQYSAPAPLFTNYRYHNIGVPPNPLVPLETPDIGLGGTLNDSTQDGKFKVPTLRNIAASPPYAHNGYFPTLTEMVNFLNDNGGVTPEIDENITPLVGNMGLNESEIDAIVSFLMTLTDQ